MKKRMGLLFLLGALFFVHAAGAMAASAGKNMKIKITVAKTELSAVFEDNATTQAIAARLPMTVHMEDLYDREMCYHFGPNALPTEKLRSDNYEVGDIIYWPPRGSFVILYRQNGERFSRQQLGHIERGVEIFETTGDADVTFELVGE